MNSVIEAHLTYLHHYPMMVSPFIRMVNYRFFTPLGCITLHASNQREDDFNKLRNRDFQISIIDQKYEQEKSHIRRENRRLEILRQRR